MRLYELATLTFAPGLGTSCVPAIQVALQQPESAGRLAGCWQSEISRQNLVLLLREFDDAGELDAERRRLLCSSDPFGCGQQLRDLSLESYAPFPGFDAVPTGPRGPYYEFRNYRLPIGGLAPTLAAWSEMVPRRAEVSEPTLIMHALDGRCRFIHIWGYPSLAERERLRAEALSRRVWPPSSAPQWLTTDMTSEVFVPTEISPLQ